MASQSVDLIVIGGGIHGAAIARDAAGRGLKVLLAEKRDYASATSSASSKLIHGGLRYLEQLQLRLVREALVERAGLLRTAPHLVTPLRFLLPIYRWQKRPGLLVKAGLTLYDLLSIGDGLPASGRLDAAEIAELPGLRREGLSSVLHYHDCRTDDARLALAVLLDARARGADIRNRRAVTSIAPLTDGYRVELDERGTRSSIEARFVVNATGPWANIVDAMSGAAPPPRPLRLVRGSHIVLAMPEPALADAYMLQDEDERVIFVLPWLDHRFLIVGTTDVPQEGDAGHPQCSDAERDYLLDAYNRYFAHATGPALPTDIVFTWSGVRALHDDAEERPSRVSRTPAISTRANGTGGFVTLYGGKLTTHRAFAEKVVDALRGMGADIGGGWTEGVPLYGGGMPRASLLALAGEGPELVPHDTARRWALSYGDQIQHLYESVMREPRLAAEIAPGVPLAELIYAREVEDAMTGEDFLLRRSKLQLLLDPTGRNAVTAWFEKG